MEHLARVYNVTHFGEPVAIRPELGETGPIHADMLRYDLAFHDPNNLSRVVFPIFRDSQAGRTSSNITLARWRSWSMKLTEVGEEVIVPDKWITYRHPANDYANLEPKTLEQYLAESKMKLVGWR